VWRAILSGVSVVLAAVCGVVTALVTAHPSRGLWVALSVVVVAGGVSQVAVTYGERRERGSVEARGDAAVAVRGSTRGAIRTRAIGGRVPSAVPSGESGVVASGPGAVSVGGDAEGSISTDASGDQAGGS
jgi:hypothetical protein